MLQWLHDAVPFQQQQLPIWNFVGLPELLGRLEHFDKSRQKTTALTNQGVTDGQVVRAFVLVTWNVLSWSEVTSSNPGRVELGVLSTSVQSRTSTKHIEFDKNFEWEEYMKKPTWAHTTDSLWTISSKGTMRVDNASCPIYCTIKITERDTYQVISPELVTIWLSSRNLQHDRYPVCPGSSRLTRTLPATLTFVTSSNFHTHKLPVTSTLVTIIKLSHL